MKDVVARLRLLLYNRDILTFHTYLHTAENELIIFLIRPPFKKPFPLEKWKDKYGKRRRAIFFSIFVLAINKM